MAASGSATGEFALGTVRDLGGTAPVESDWPVPDTVEKHWPSSSGIGGPPASWNARRNGASESAHVSISTDVRLQIQPGWRVLPAGGTKGKGPEVRLNDALERQRREAVEAARVRVFSNRVARNPPRLF